MTNSLSARLRLSAARATGTPSPVPVAIQTGFAEVEIAPQDTVPGEARMQVPVEGQDAGAQLTTPAPAEVKVQTLNQVPVEEPPTMAAHASTPLTDGGTKHYERGPKRRVSRGPNAARAIQKAIAEVAKATSIPLAVVGLNAAKSNGTYRMNLKQESLARALPFDPDTLTEADKAHGYEVALYSTEVERRVNDALKEHGLDEYYEVVCPSVPTILDANLTRVLPHTPALSVLWPEGLRGPAKGRTKRLLVAVEQIRVMAEDAPVPVENTEPVTAAMPEPPDDGWFAGDENSAPVEPEAEAQRPTESLSEV